MRQEECEELLNSHGIKPTANRIVVLRGLATTARPLTQTELEQRLQSIDKSGISRTLTLFRDHHLVHAVDDGNGALHYELCHSHSHEEDDDRHVHFFCERCRRTLCLDGVPVPQVPLPPGFVATGHSHLVKGICPACSGH